MRACIIAHNRTIWPCHPNHVMLLALVLPMFGINDICCENISSDAIKGTYSLYSSYLSLQRLTLPSLLPSVL